MGASLASSAGRALQLLGLVVTGIGFFLGLLAGNVRGELTLLAIGAAVFFSGRFLDKSGRGA
jgi:hypothetical protein